MPIFRIYITTYGYYRWWKWVLMQYKVGEHVTFDAMRYCNTRHQLWVLSYFLSCLLSSLNLFHLFTTHSFSFFHSRKIQVLWGRSKKKINSALTILIKTSGLLLLGFLGLQYVSFKYFCDIYINIYQQESTTSYISKNFQEMYKMMHVFWIRLGLHSFMVCAVGI